MNLRPFSDPMTSILGFSPTTSDLMLPVFKCCQYRRMICTIILNIDIWRS